MLRHTTILWTLISLPLLSLIFRSEYFSESKSAVLSMSATVGGREWCVCFWCEERGKSENSRSESSVGEENAWTPLCHSRVQTAAMTVEVKCEVHVATTNGLSADDVFVYR